MSAIARFLRWIAPRRRHYPLPSPQPSAVRGHFYGDSAGAGRVRTS